MTSFARCALILLTVAGMLWPIPVSTRADASDPSRLSPRQVFTAGFVNGQRTTQDLRGLRRSRALSECAQRHARRMRRVGDIWHSRNKCGARGEIVGTGPTIASTFRAFWGSREHRSIILGKFRRIGVGAVRDGNLWWYLVVVFL